MPISAINYVDTRKTESALSVEEYSGAGRCSTALTLRAYMELPYMAMLLEVVKRSAILVFKENSSRKIVLSKVALELHFT